ncbi:calcium-activated potassium channel subunit beta-2-like [Branchiostoma lanceolatum]|uniref:calcium-activated potassium channel subunit beta-2-like n=1 Tax=Branchiostoma lanceolatum TaxID=7740 RepID=UPI00345147E1
MDEKQSATRQYRRYSCYFWLAGGMAVGCAVALIVCGNVIVKPMVETDSLNFQETTCTTDRSYLTGQWITCGCGKYCSSRYPCLRVTVTYVLNNATVNAVLFDTEQRLNSNGDNAENTQCVTASCVHSEDTNRATVLDFNNTHAAGQAYTCLYNPDDTTKVLLTRLFTWDAMFHSMLWTSIGTAIFAGLTVYFIYQCKKAREKMASIPVTVPPGASGTRAGYFLPPPAYPGESLPMQPAPPSQDPYSTDYGSTDEKKGLTLN